MTKHWNEPSILAGLIHRHSASMVVLVSFLLVACPEQQQPLPEPIADEPIPVPPNPKPKQSPCPSARARDITLKDPVVKQAREEAWRRSKEGTPEEHEEAFWVVQKRTRKSNGDYEYRTEIVWDDPGTGDSVAGSNLPRVSKGRIVLRHHTHPGPAGEAPPGHCYNECASDDDENIVDRTGIPGTYTYGSGPDPAKTTTNLIPLPDSTLLEEPRFLNWKCPEPSSTSVNGGAHPPDDEILPPATVPIPEAEETSPDNSVAPRQCSFTARLSGDVPRSFIEGENVVWSRPGQDAAKVAGPLMRSLAGSGIGGPIGDSDPEEIDHAISRMEGVDHLQLRMIEGEDDVNSFNLTVTTGSGTDGKARVMALVDGMEFIGSSVLKIRSFADGWMTGTLRAETGPGDGVALKRGTGPAPRGYDFQMEVEFVAGNPFRGAFCTSVEDE